MFYVSSVLRVLEIDTSVFSFSHVASFWTNGIVATTSPATVHPLTITLTPTRIIITFLTPIQTPLNNLQIQAIGLDINLLQSN